MKQSEGNKIFYDSVVARSGFRGMSVKVEIGFVKSLVPKMYISSEILLFSLCL